MILQEGQILYHGSYAPVPGIDLAFGEEGKDFGKGFYVTTDKDQAVSFIRLSTRKAIASGRVPPETSCGYLSVYRFHAADNLVQYEFETTNRQWLQFVAGNRLRDFSGIYSAQQLIHIAESDIIGGKIANDATNITLTNYMTGAYGAMGTRAADDFCISLLLPERLKDQYCFRTTKALAQLRFLKSTRVWM